MSQVVVVLHSLDPAQDLGEVEGLNGNALGLQNFFAVTHRIEGGRTGADCANPQIAEAVHHATDGGKPLQIVSELRRIRALGVQRSNRVRDAVLLKVVAG